MHLKHKNTNAETCHRAKTNINLQNAGLVAFYDIRPEMERAYSYKPGAQHGVNREEKIVACQYV